MSCHTSDLLAIYEKQIKMRKRKSKLLHRFRGMGVHIYEWGLQVRLNPKLLLQPYRPECARNEITYLFKKRNKFA